MDVPRLTQEQHAEIQDAFKLYDRNGDGEITVEELGDAMRELGETCTPEELNAMIRAVDINGNGKVEYKEFQQMMASKLGCPLCPDDLYMYFKHFDTNGDGYISEDELTAVMRSYAGKISDKKIKDMMLEADTNSDGKVSYEEFCAVMKKTAK